MIPDMDDKYLTPDLTTFSPLPYTDYYPVYHVAQVGGQKVLVTFAPVVSAFNSHDAATTYLNYHLKRRGYELKIKKILVLVDSKLRAFDVIEAEDFDGKMVLRVADTPVSVKDLDEWLAAQGVDAPADGRAFGAY